MVSDYSVASVAWSRVSFSRFSFWKSLLHKVSLDDSFQCGPAYKNQSIILCMFVVCSDVSDIPDETYPLLEDCELLIIVTPLLLISKFGFACWFLSLCMIHHYHVNCFVNFHQDALRPDRSSATHFGLPRVGSIFLSPFFFLKYTLHTARWFDLH